ncbi:5592_t:CDS:2 [Ambispora gerdemannii]|uniref:5592_t:CDS:1 n=1 Tax=Ambispora gerdemannii TaxID=144530 RepID=A0A9N9CK50_9GLOM|nr:5592_t:CDS:2 [Ambispora gerdemannii]
MSVPQPRKVWAIAHTGTLNNLKFEDDLLPPPPPDNVRVKVHCIGLNFADIFAILGVYSATPKEKFIPGLEFSGVVEAVGENVDQKKWLGKRVYGVTRFGGFATFINQTIVYVKETPERWTDQEACAFLAQGMTAFYALKELGALKPKQTVLVHSAAGGVGLLALAILAKFQAKAIGTVGNNSKLDLLNTRYGDNPNFSFILRDPARDFEERTKKELEKMGEEGFDIVLDSIMGDWFWPNYRLTKSAGRLIAYGSASLTPAGNLHPIWNIFSWIKLAWKYFQRPKFDPMNMIKDNKGILGFNLIHIYHQEDKLTSIFDELSSLELDPPLVGHEFPLEQVHEAIQLLQSGKTVGKVVLNVEHV